ncbi:hypothetical protein SERLADRAFT_418661 [Serpula lacrymans var. lacrymans S7.9]|uniref:Phosphatases II n=1 Tax=Serpula lacrymans var. lacrymans (strain S7.9) TaxID=578457 RepID=F8PCT5_SERL9|nr:uncharacterized protein SERLADRAFT_418661 [Serpula lacrymans var. lacrymans S7.9]EGO19034.1 hypothetical protein SERLADRAFT_418661 [Serpula lacrymans var. lacrymans S7.9]
MSPPAGEMGSTSTNNIPRWLQLASSADHIDSSLSLLQARERTRNNARKATRPQVLPSRVRQVLSPSASNELSKYYSISVGANPDNLWGNRYSNIEPYDRTRVIVGGAVGALADGSVNSTVASLDGRYFNGSWVRELFGGKWWIATQAPLPQTSHVFLSALLQPIHRPMTLDSATSPPIPSRVRTVVQLTQNFESGRRKADAYFPSKPGQSFIVPPERGCTAPSLQVTLLESRTLKESRCIQSKLKVSIPILQSNQDRAQSVIFTHMLYAAWPDHGVPEEEDKESLLSFLRLVDETNKNTSSQDAVSDPDPPIMVNCSAGIGRTGSFVAISSLFRAFGLFNMSSLSASLPRPLIKYPHTLPQSPLGPLPKEFEDDPVAQEVDSLREQRPGMVQREEQLVLIYELLVQAYSRRGAC